MLFSEDDGTIDIREEKICVKIHDLLHKCFVIGCYQTHMIKKCIIEAWYF